MKVLFHPEFPRDQRTFEADYAEISAGLAARFRAEIEEAIDAIEAAPSAAGHFVNTGSTVVSEFRRRNLNAFPFFVLYGCTSVARATHRPARPADLRRHNPEPLRPAELADAIP